MLFFVVASRALRFVVLLNDLLVPLRLEWFVIVCGDSCCLVMLCCGVSSYVFPVDVFEMGSDSLKFALVCASVATRVVLLFFLTHSISLSVSLPLSFAASSSLHGHTPSSMSTADV